MSLLRAVRTWGEMVKFSHTVFALPFALLATCMAGRHLPGGVPRGGQVALILVCMVAARSFAMTINRIVDRDIDARNPRTAGRPLPSRRISLSQARAFAVLSATGFIAACLGFRWLYANSWPVILSLPTLGLLAGYSYCKRFTALAHFVLGAALGVAPAAAWLAIDPASIGAPVLLLSAAVLLWIAGFDIIYACQDIDIDRRDGLHSCCARWGIGPALWVSRSCHVATIGLLFAFGLAMQRGGLYYAGVVVAAALLAAEQSVIRAGDLSRVGLAFFTINGCVSIIFAAMAAADLYWRG